ncbi:MAG: hypothetical protein QGG40_01590 [Myxococcota bacterium]|jgi:hypothetical protein|nr:hypothetical protein [Myxococcota bacterium]
MPTIHRTVPLAALLGLLPQLQGCKGCHETDLVQQDTVDDEFTNDWGNWLSMDLMPDGSPALAYYDRTRGALGFALGALGDDGVSWSHEEVDGYPDDDGLDTGDRGTYASMAVASDGTVWIAYYDVNLKHLRYAVRDTDGVWTTGTADVGDGASPDAGKFASLTLDADENPVIAHYDVGKARLRIARWNGSGFTGEVVDEGEDHAPDSGEEGEEATADVGSFAELQIVDGTEYIAYYDAAHGALKLAHGSTGSYEIEIIDDEGDVGQWPDLWIDGGTMHLAYHDVENQDLRLAIGTPGSWTLTSVDDGDLVGADAEVFALNGSPAIAYFDGANNDLLVAELDGGSWVSSTLAGDDAALGYHTEIAQDGDTTYIACYDYTQRDVWFQVLD